MTEVQGTLKFHISIVLLYVKLLLFIIIVLEGK